MEDPDQVTQPSPERPFKARPFDKYRHYLIFGTALMVILIFLIRPDVAQDVTEPEKSSLTIALSTYVVQEDGELVSSEQINWGVGSVIQFAVTSADRGYMRLLKLSNESEIQKIEFVGDPLELIPDEEIFFHSGAEPFAFKKQVDDTEFCLVSAETEKLLEEKLQALTSLDTVNPELPDCIRI